MIRWGLGVASQGGVGIAEKPTGTGKSAVAAAVGSKYRTCVLVQKKALQDAYRELYGARLLKGKGNYPCVHPFRSSFEDMVDDCHIGNHRDCSFDCLYDLAKDAVLRSMFSSVNYAYWLSSHSFREKLNPFLFMDEGHLLPDLTINHAGIKISEKERVRWGLPPFPLLKTGKGRGVFIISQNPVEPALAWLESCLPPLYAKRAELKGKDREGLTTLDSGKVSTRFALKVCTLRIRKIQAAIGALRYSSNDWYIRSGFMVKGFIAKPLTAKYHFNGYFIKNTQGGIIMSATIGDFGTLAGELGIMDYDTRRVPGMWPPESKPVYVLDVPKLNYQSSTADYDRQAKAIADAIKSCPNTWSGIIHVTRKLETKYLTQRLAKNGLADRVWPAPEMIHGRYIGTGERIKLWNERRARRPNSIVVAWDMGEGYDGLEEKITIAAKVPFPNLGDEFEKERMKYSGSMYLQRTAWALEQSLGRTRRGREEDYDVEGERRGLVAIADGNWVRVRKYLSEDFKEALVHGKVER